MPERAAQLYSAAVALFIERGYHDVGVDDIVARCGVSHGTFYGYFRNKRDLLESILNRTEDDLLTVVAGEDDWPAVADCEVFVAAFRALITRALHHFADNADVLSFVLMSAPGVDAQAQELLLAGYRRIGAQVQDILAVAAQHGWMHADDHVDLVWAGQIVIAAVAAAALPLLLDPDTSMDIAEASRICADYLLGGTGAVLSGQ